MTSPALSLLPSSFAPVPKELPGHMAVFFRSSFGTEAPHLARHMAACLAKVDPSASQLYRDTAALLLGEQ